MGEVKLSGPLFDGRAKRVTAQMADEAGEAIADQGVNDVRQIVALAAHHRTGNYESHVVTDRAGADRVVNDSGIIYGPWLEGVASRNTRSRFKGFAAFRRTAQRLQDRAVVIAEPAVRKRMGQLR